MNTSINQNVIFPEYIDHPYSGNITIYFSKKESARIMINIPEIKYCCNCQQLYSCSNYKKNNEYSYYNYSCEHHVPI
jgi:hypothetical protein